MTVLDLIKLRANTSDAIINIEGANPNDKNDPYIVTYYTGKIENIPEIYYNCDVIETAWSSSPINSDTIVIPYYNGDENYNPMRGSKSRKKVSQVKAEKKYLEKFDEIKLRVPKGMKDEIKYLAKMNGQSMNEFITGLIENAK